MNQQQAFQQLVAVAQALERQMREDPIDAAELGSEATAHAISRGCNENDVEASMASLLGLVDGEPDAVNPEQYLCFAAWFAAIKHGLVQRGYLEVE